MKHQALGMHGRLTARLIDTLYTEAMLLADEARSYFDDVGRADRDSLTPLLRVGFSCESLKVTTRLMHVVAWLLTRRAVETGEISAGAARMPQRRLDKTIESDPGVVAALPEAARQLIEGSCDLYARVARFDQGLEPGDPAPSPARTLLHRLEQAF
jgi:regulator of CtrA degradation